ncbi:MAG: NAD-dependent epimerase/dehydratase family protein [Pyrinomonadaceae bacterium]|nr:NAD-dependent epimerase/dehydratase family protein [Pyrinomonadaceae bacterium]MCX7640661.1 NAD-dependent epimerase/dehydratase family protein [Pyrinomonadaceae bacterium]MDW8305062.1 NAD-dependent epimerase/dehydratase family protein [Acidobacteriota bacterium]
MKCAVLGSDGFIGSHLTEALLAKGYDVKCFDKTIRSKIPRIEKIEGNFLDEESLRQALRGCDTCFHLISTTLPSSSNESPIFDVQTNVIGTIRLLELCLEENVQKVIFISSGGTVYGMPLEIPIKESHPTNPICSYGITKLTCEKYLSLFHHLYGLEYRILRVANAFGERQKTNSAQGAIAVFLAKALRDEEIEIWGDGSTVRDYIHVDDVIDAFLRVMAYEGEQKIFNIGSGNGRSLNEVLDTIEKVLAKRIKKIYTGKKRRLDVPINVLSIELAKRELMWSPKVEFDEGVERFAKWLKERL